MKTDRFKKIEEIYHAALELPPKKRALFLEEKCGEDAGLKAEIGAMLAFEETENSLLDNPPEDLAAEMIREEETGNDLLLDKKIGRYKIQKVLGEGGMGTVYLARDERLARSVALKVLPAEMIKNEERVQRFIHEARAASALNHPHILTVYEIDEFEDTEFGKIHFISMEFVDGKTLQDLIYSPQISTSDLLKYLAQTAEGLAKAHSAGIIHRDLKPENIMVSSDGYAKILDFGLAKLTDAEHELHKLQQHKSRPGVILGTLGYMSPEQAQGKSSIDERSDIFSYGCILYEAVTRRKAFDAESTIDALHKIVHSEPAPVADFVSATPDELRELIDECLQKNPAERLQKIADASPVLQKFSQNDFGEIIYPVFDNEPKTAILDKVTTHPTISKQFSEQRRQVTVMYADISAVLEVLEDFEPEEASEIMRNLWSFLEEIISGGGGKIGERLNDIFISIWGTKAVNESDPEKCVRTGLELQTKLKSYFKELIINKFEISEADTEDFKEFEFLKVGISTGTVLLGHGVNTEEFVTTGSAVNAAKRLLFETSPGEIYVSHDTYRHIRGIFDVEEVKAEQKLSLKGKKPVAKTYLIKGVKPRAFRLETRGVEGIETEMVGREGELSKMLDSLEAVFEDRELQAVTVIGEAGLGKSRLLFEFQDEAELLPEKFYVFKARALETMRGLPYSLVRNLFSFRFEIQESDTQKIAREKFVEGVMELTCGADAVFGEKNEAELKAHFIGHLVGLNFSDSPHIKAISDNEKQIQDRALSYATQFFAAVSGKFPLVIYLDDLHWADDESLNFFDLIARQCSASPILITEFARPILFERRPHWGEGQQNRLRLNLHPLTKRESRRLVADILQRAEEVPKDLQNLLISNTEGNPFYVEELIKMFIEQGVINSVGEKWAVDSNRLGEISVPPTLTGVLQSRLDKLSVWEKRILQRASVIGREFWDKALQGFERDVNVSTILESLRNKELLFRKENSTFENANEYLFKHALLRDVTYETVLLEERRKWHAETARWLIAKEGERENEYLAVIAEHFEKAKEFERSSEWFGKAGEQALRRYALDISEVYFQKALEFWKSVSDQKETASLTYEQIQKWRLGLGKVVYEKARFPEAIKIFNEVLKDAEASDDKLGQAKAYWGLSFSQFENGETRSSLESSKETVRLAEAIDSGLIEEKLFLQSSGWYRQGRALLSLGSFDETIACAEKALEISNKTGVEGLLAKANSLHLLASANLFLGRFDEAEKFEKQEVEISRRIGDKRTLGNGLNSLGVQSYMRGDGKKALAYYREALEIAREVGNKTGEIMILSNIGGAKVYLEEYESAEDELKSLIEEVGDRGHFLVPEMYRFLAEALIGQNKFQEALEIAGKSFYLSKESENQEMIAEAWRVLGIISSGLRTDISIGEKSLSASECFQKSLEIFKNTGMKANYAQTLHNLARYEKQRGDTEKAEGLFLESAKLSEQLKVDTEAKNIYFK